MHHRADRQQMAGDAAELGGDDAAVLAALRHVDVAEPLDTIAQPWLQNIAAT
jgi:hypothetical protein